MLRTTWHSQKGPAEHDLRASKVLYKNTKANMGCNDGKTLLETRSKRRIKKQKLPKHHALSLRVDTEHLSRCAEGTITFSWTTAGLLRSVPAHNATAGGLRLPRLRVAQAPP